MRTISVQMSDAEYKELGLSKDRFYFSEIASLIEDRIFDNEPCMFTEKELIERAEEAERSFEAGLGIPHEEMLKRHVI